jgi:hypothetical protein
MKYFIILIIGEIIGAWAYHEIELPNVIEKRAKELNILKYDSKTDKYIIKDSVCINNYDFEYLKNSKIK